jgi:hypothetical protein
MSQVRLLRRLAHRRLTRQADEHEGFSEWCLVEASWPQPADRNTDEDDLPFAAEEDKRDHHNP